VLSIITLTMFRLNRQQNKAKNPTTTVPKKEITLVSPYLGVQSKIVTKQLKTCIKKLCGCINLRVALTLGLLFKASSLYFPTKIETTVPNSQKLCIRLAVGTARIFILEN